MKLLHATGNDLKYSLMKKRLEEFKKIELITPKMLGIKIDVEEDGKTAEQNSIKKAKAYYEIAKIPVIAEDAGKYFDERNKEEEDYHYKDLNEKYRNIIKKYILKKRG